MSCQQRICVGIASLWNIFRKCDSVLQNGKSAGFLGCFVLLWTEIMIGKKASSLYNSFQEGRRKWVKTVCDAPKKRMKRTCLTNSNLSIKSYKQPWSQRNWVVKKRLVAGLPKFSITSSKRAVIDWVCFNSGSKRYWNLAVTKLSDLA